MQITSPVTNAMPVRRVEERRHGNPSVAQRRDGSLARVHAAAPSRLIEYSRRMPSGGAHAATGPEQMQETVAKKGCVKRRSGDEETPKEVQSRRRDCLWSEWAAHAPSRTLMVCVSRGAVMMKPARRATWRSGLWLVGTGDCWSDLLSPDLNFRSPLTISYRRVKKLLLQKLKQKVTFVIWSSLTQKVSSLSCLFLRLCILKRRMRFQEFSLF
jgi:hypothetical protein